MAKTPDEHQQDDEKESTPVTPGPFAFGQWLGALEHVKEGGAPSADYPDNIKQRLLYILEPDGEKDIRLHFLCARILKGGGYGKATAYDPANILTYAVPQYVLAADERILREVAGDCSLSSIRGYRLKGPEGMSIFKRALATGRCHWRSKDASALARGDKRKGEWCWQLSAGGDQYLTLAMPQEELVVPTSPPWYIDPALDRCGPIESGQPADVAEILLNMQAVELDCSDKVIAQVVAQMPDGIPGPVHLQHDRRAVKPLPVLKLHSVKLAQRWGYRTPDYCHVAELWFDYDGTRTPWQSQPQPIRVIRDARVIDYRRDTETEREAFEVLEQAGMERLSFSGMADLFEVEPQMFTLADSDYWPEWMLYEIEAMEEHGFIIEVAEQFGFKLEHAHNWQLDIDRSRAPGASGLMGEANLKVTLESGEEVDLIAALARWVGSQPALLKREALEDMRGKASVALPLADGRLLAAPGAMVASILHFMLDVFAAGKSEAAKVSAPQLLALEEQLTGMDAPVSITSGDWLRQMRSIVETDAIPECPPPAGLQAELRDYQRQGLSWMQFLRSMNLAGILADDMGLGKTVQALAHILIEKEAGRLTRPALVIAPTSLMHNWRREAEKFTPDLSVLVIHGPERARLFGQITEHDLILTTYPLLARDFEVLAEQSWHMLILDEAHYIKNPRAKSSQLVRRLKSNHRICMTGTPMENHLGELWAQFDFLMPGYLFDQRGFSRLFRKPIEMQGDSARQDALNVRIRPFLLRRTKNQVALELPDKTEILRSVEIEGEQRELYESVRLAMQKRVSAAVASAGLAQSQIVVLDALMKMRQVCCDPRLVSGISGTPPESAKLNMLLEMLPEMIEEGRKILLFSQFTSMLQLIENELKRLKIGFVKLTGQTRDRETPIESFQNGEVPLFLISLKAGGVGLNLTAADTVIHFDPWWNPAAEAQATDRAHRIGQEKAVFVYKLITEGTVEEKILELQERKRQLADAIHQSDVSRGALWSADDLEGLFSPLA